MVCWLYNQEFRFLIVIFNWSQLWRPVLSVHPWFPGLECGYAFLLHDHYFSQISQASCVWIILLNSWTCRDNFDFLASYFLWFGIDQLLLLSSAILALIHFGGIISEWQKNTFPLGHCCQLVTQWAELFFFFQMKLNMMVKKGNILQKKKSFPALQKWSAHFSDFL